MEWRPAADAGALHARATLLDLIRRFFKARLVLEVNTPLLTRSTVTDPHLHSFQINDSVAGAGRRLYLQTSPEYAMKRLLADGSGPIYQVCPAFRDEEHGIHHNPEFTLLEWYRPGFTLEDLMDEVDELLNQCLNSPPGKRLTYQQAFIQTIEIDPFNVEREALIRKASKRGLVGADQLDDHGLLEFLFSHSVQTELGTGVCYIYHYPASQAALSRIEAGQPPVARRVEVFIDTLELANGYEELLDADEQRQRFEKDLAQRAGGGLHQPPADEALLAAMNHGLPQCSGIALGLDRLLMRILKVDSINRVMCFPFQDV